jgi:hypothetical protein
MFSFLSLWSLVTFIVGLVILQKNNIANIITREMLSAKLFAKDRRKEMFLPSDYRRQFVGWL